MKDSRLESLRPEFRLLAAKWLHIVTDDLGMKVRVLETRRDEARQAEVMAAGKSPLPFGFHNIGLALDWACFNDRGVYITDGRHPYYRRCGLVWQALGATWGGEWAHPDFDHAQLDGGIWRISEYLASHPDMVKA